VHFAQAKDLFDAFATAGEDILARPRAETPLEFMAKLAHSQTPEEAITFAAYLLPRRKAVWWGHECGRSLAHLLTDQDRQMLALAEAWVREPEEEQRVRALDAGLACSTKTPGVWIALAAGWSGGSMSNPGLPSVPPPPHLTPRAVNAGVLGALARVDNGHRGPTLKTFVDMAVGLTG
jgi:hypothetical protein